MREETYCLRQVLDKLSAGHKGANIIIQNGYHLKGKVLGWDSKSILVEVDGKEQLVMLHAVSTIIPMA